MTSSEGDANSENAIHIPNNAWLTCKAGGDELGFSDRSSVCERVFPSSLGSAMLKTRSQHVSFVMPGQPLSKHNLLQDGDIHDAVSVGNDLFWKNHCQPEKHSQQIGAKFNGVTFGSMSIVYLSFNAGVTIEPARNEEHFIVQMTLAGQSTTQNGRQHIATEPESIAVIDASLPTTINFKPGCAHLALKIERSLITSKLRKLLQRDIDEPLAFDLLSAQGDASRHAWTETMNFLCAFYDKPDQQILKSSCILASHIDMVTYTLISSQRHNYSEQLNNNRFTAPPRHVRLACEFVDHNIKGAISMSDLCSVTNVTERTLQNGFRKYLGQSPSTFIKSRRLHYIHRALQRAEGNINVSRIMWEHGVNNTGRWAKMYFDRYGCYPSATFKARG